ncbi:MAG: hypothetical protein A3G41_05835 [Elusimicrobia bacterium RIFCSPLOWO2_12_FULL_59_9]|nr:MAG: hypothetical protein A3G41_05835 [Elusimicrobia bacterium RIFCSPLOWO2_12_FULL_59_9]
MKQEWTCKGCRERTTSKDGIEQHDGVYFVVCAKCGAQNKIAQTGGGAGSPVQFTVVSLIPIRVIYSTEAFLAKRNYEPGQLFEASFPNLEAAKKAALPDGYTFGLIVSKEGRYVYAPNFGWQFEG